MPAKPLGVRSPLVVGAAVLYILLWSSAFIATKIGVSYSPPLTYLAIRFLVAAAIMAAFAAVDSRRALAAPSPTPARPVTRTNVTDGRTSIFQWG